jgi:iron complex outermembrane receptor protein
MKLASGGEAYVAGLIGFDRLAIAAPQLQRRCVRAWARHDTVLRTQALHHRLAAARLASKHLFLFSEEHMLRTQPHGAQRRTPLAWALLSIFGAGGFGAGALAQTAAPAEPQRLEKVEITGSSIRRIEGETASPVQILTREDIARTGAVTVEQLLQTVTTSTSSGNLAASAATGATSGSISSVSLRGLTSLRTLVLINGQRVTPYGVGFTGDSVSVDVNSIPIAAIDRVEILKDGASAVYGSDAIGGVVNFILRRDFVGAEVTAEYGDTTQGGGRVNRVSGAWGTGSLGADGYNVMLIVNYQKEQAIYGRDRPFARSSVSLATQNDGTSGNTFPANVVLPDGTTVNPAYPNCAPSVVSAVYEANGLTNRCRYDPSEVMALFPQAERGGLFFASKFAMSQDIEAFIEASISRNRQLTTLQAVPISDQFALPPNHPLFNVAPYNGFSTIELRPGTPFYPTAFIQNIVGAGNALPVLLVRYRALENGDRSTTDTSQAPRFTAGFKGTLANWDFDTAFLYSQSEVRQNVNNGYPSLVAILPLLNSGQVNFFGPNTPEITAQLRAANFYGEALRWKTSLTGVSGKASRDLVQLPAGPLALAAGAEARKEKYRVLPNPTIQSGDIAGYGGNFFPINQARDVYALFSELNVPIVRSLEANLAVRYDDYQGSDSSTSPKVGVRWQAIRPLLVRASYGQGFRAPSLADLYSPNQTGVTPAGLNDPARCGPGLPNDSNSCATQFAIITGGNTALRSEESENVTLGLVFEPTSNISMTFDFFKVNLEETIANGIPAAVILSDLAKYGNLITRGAPTAGFPNVPGPITQINQTNINQGRTKLAGFEIDWRFGLPLKQYGKLAVNLSGTYFDKFDTENPDGTFTGNVDTPNVSTSGLIPRWRHYLSLNWVFGPWSSTLAQNYQGDYQDVAGNFSNAGDPLRTVSAYTTYDLQTTYSGVKSWKLTVGMRNVLDKDPPFTNTGGTVSFQAGYDPQYGDPRGRFIYARAAYSIK